MRVWLVVGVVSVLSTGCLTTNPARGTKATGETLSVVDEVGWHSHRQGGRFVDEQDFYAIASDQSAVNAIRKKRRTLVFEQYVDNAIGLGGIAGIVSGGGLMAAGIVWVVAAGPIGLIALLPGALLMTASIVAVPMGFVAANKAAARMDDPVMSSSRAHSAADAYNGRTKKKKKGRVRTIARCVRHGRTPDSDRPRVCRREGVGVRDRV